MEPIDVSAVVLPARKCPHYITVARAKTLASMCEHCTLHGPPGVYGQFGKSGPAPKQRQPDLSETVWPLELEDPA